MANAIGIWEVFVAAIALALFAIFVRVFFPRASFFKTRSRAGVADDRLTRLERLDRLRTSGTLTDEEFEHEKQRVLGGRS